MVVRRSFAGGRATVVLVAFAAHEAARHGEQFLRLDYAPMPKLMKVYERLGFGLVDVISLPLLGTDYRAARFERLAGPATD
jgi:hypothetical protein